MIKTFAFFIVLSVSVYAQSGIDLTYNVPNNSEFEYTTTVDLEVPSFLQIDMRVISTSKVKKNGEDYAISNRIKKVVGTSSLLGVVEKIDSDSANFAQTSTGKEMNHFLNKELNALYSKKGKLLSELDEENTPQDPLFRLAFPERNLTVGDSWVSEEELPNVSLPIAFRYTISDITEDFIFLTLSMPEDWQAEGTKVESFKGTTQLYKKTGLVFKSFVELLVDLEEDDLKMKLTMNVEGKQILK